MLWTSVQKASQCQKEVLAIYGYAKIEAFGKKNPCEDTAMFPWRLVLYEDAAIGWKIKVQMG